MRILVFGAGVIGSVYAGKLRQAGHEVVLVARGRRLSDLRANGLVLEEARSGQRTVLPVPSVSEAGADERYDLVLVPVRAEQLSSTLPVLAAMSDGSDVLFFGNTAGRQAELTAALGNRALFGFPAAGGVRDGAVIRYVLISQQKTMLGERDGSTTPRVRDLHGVFSAAGFSTEVSVDIDGWLVAHTAFVVPLAFALYRVGVDPGQTGGRPSYAAADGACHPAGVHGAARRRHHRNPQKPAHPLPLAYRVRCRLLATRPGQSPRRAVVRRAHPRRARGNALAGPTAAGSAAPHRTSHARPRPVTGHPSLSRRPFRKPIAQRTRLKRSRSFWSQ